MLRIARTRSARHDDGKVVWERRDLECNHFRAPARRDSLREPADHALRTAATCSMFAALDKRRARRCGRLIGRSTSRTFIRNGNEGTATTARLYATPHIVMSGQHAGAGQSRLEAAWLRPAHRQRIGVVEEKGISRQHAPGSPSRPGVFSTGFNTPRFWPSVRTARVDVTNSHVVWKFGRGVPNKPSLLLLGDVIYMINDGGIVTSVDAKTGQEVWRSRLLGSYSASPVAADGRIYFFSEDGKATVIEAGREFKVLSENTLESGFMASPAIDGRALYLRTKTHLYRIEEQR